MEVNPEQLVLNYCQNLGESDVLDRPCYRRRRSPLFATIADPEISHVDLIKIIEAGANVIWFKTALLSRKEKIRTLGKVDKATAFLSEKHGIVDWPVATCIELKTSIVNTGLLEGEEEYIVLKEGAIVTLTYDLEQYNKCNKKTIFVDNPFIGVEVKVGMEISIANDEIILRCKAKVSDVAVRCVVTKGGRLSDLCIVCARGAVKKLPFITKKDLQIVKFALDYQVDMIIINYARQAETIRKLKKFIGKKVKRPQLVTGICTMDGLNDIDDILKESDGILFSREFLAYELVSTDLYKMMRIQKWVGARCQQIGKPFYISGGVFHRTLESGEMSDNEISDVTNALLDGVSGFVLKESDDVENTVDVIRTMNDICCAVEPFTNVQSNFWRILDEIKMPTNAAEASAMSCALLAMQTNARVIVVPTVSGRTVKTLLWLRPHCIIITISTNTRATRLLQTYRCCVPLLYKGAPMKKWNLNQEARVNFAIEYAVKRGWLRYGDTYITLQRAAEVSSFCDMVRVWSVAISRKHFVECPQEDDEDED